MHSTSQQLTLDVGLRDGFRFKSFYTEKNTNNHQLIQILQSFLASQEQSQNYLWGEPKSGKTHLLQACCAKVAEKQQLISYIPLKTFVKAGPKVITGLTHSQFIAIDDIDIVLGDKKWEVALFNLINITRENGQRLLLSSTQNPRLLGCVLPDLASRLIWGGSYQVQALSDDEKPKALQARAQQRGFELTDRVTEYLYRRYPRDIETLNMILDTLDKESLRQKTLITIPFVKQVLKDS